MWLDQLSIGKLRCCRSYRKKIKNKKIKTNTARNKNVDKERHPRMLSKLGAMHNKLV